MATAQAEPLVFSFADPVGDNTGAIDVTAMSFDFDNATGDYTITLTATTANPFVGQFRVNINLFNPDAITIANLFSDALNDFNLASPTTTSLTLTGTNPIFWHGMQATGLPLTTSLLAIRLPLPPLGLQQPTFQLAF